MAQSGHSPSRRSMSTFGGKADITDSARQGLLSANDPGCVKTHTSAKCRKNNSSRRHHTSRRQGDLTLRRAIASRCFYVYGECWSFHTAKTQSGQERAAFAAMHGPDLLVI